MFRNDAGQPLYVGKSVGLRSRARAHFAASSPDGDWVAQAEVVEHTETASELGALLLEHATIRRLRPPGNVRHKHQDPYVYLRCRLDIAFPVLELAPEPAAGRAVNVGPLRGRHVAAELLEQLNSLFGLRHCGRRLARRAVAVGLRPDGPLPVPVPGGPRPQPLPPAPGRGARTAGRRRAALLAHVAGQMHAAAAEQAFERAAWLRRRRARLAELLERLGGVLEATHVRPRLVLAPAPDGRRADAVWLAGGRVAAWGEARGADDLAERTARVLRSAGGSAPGSAPVHLTPDEVGAARIAATWCDANRPPELVLDPPPSRARLAAFARAAGSLEHASAIA